MQKFDAELLAKNLNCLAEVFDRKPVTAGALQAWFDVLKEFPTERIMGVLIGWPKSHNKFPTPADVWKVCNEICIDEREHKARQERQIERWEPSTRGHEFLAKMRQMLNRPARRPKEHWEHVLKTRQPGSIGHEYAAVVMSADKDDEPQAVSF